jgi:transcription initiation factor TFIIIB Brf1 subunit/transcription initiation factor TFIIB
MNRLIDDKNGDIICTDCGAVVCSKIIGKNTKKIIRTHNIDSHTHDFVDEGAEWRSFDDSNRQDMCRAGSTSKTGAVFTTLTAGGSQENQRMIQRANSSLRSTLDKKIESTVKVLENFSSRLRVSEKIVKISIETVISAYHANIGRYPKETLSTAILYIICTKEGYPRTLHELSHMSGVEMRSIAALSTTIIQLLGMTKPVIQPESLVHRFASKLRLNFITAELAREMSILVVSQAVIESVASPQIIAAACITLTGKYSGVLINTSDLETITGCSKSSISKLVDTLEPFMSVIKPARLKLNDKIVSVSTSISPVVHNKIEDMPSSSLLGKRKLHNQERST